jgi:predicted permease
MVALTTFLIRALIRLYPRRFRDRFELDLADTVRRDLERAAGNGRIALLAASGQAVADAAGGLLPEHRSELRGVRFAAGDDVRDAVRSLRQSPTFTLVALGVLVLGIGAATAIFSVVDAVVLRGLPFDEHDRIISVLEYNPERRELSGSTMPQNYLDWRERQQSFASLAATNRIQYRLRNERGGLENARGLRVTSEFFPVLRTYPFVGTAFSRDEEVDGRGRVVILSHGCWMGRFGGGDVLGRTIELNDERYEIVGIMPPRFSYPVGSAQPVELFTPIAFRAVDRVRKGPHNYQYGVIGRLEDRITLAQASEEMNRVTRAVDADNPGWNTLNPGGHVRLLTLHEHLVGRVRSWMLMLLGSVTLLLLTACANVANLMLARATVRGREMGVRAALGATRSRLVRGLLVEGIILSLLAAAIGTALAYAGVRVLTAWMPPGIPRVADIGIDMRVLFATIGAAIVTGTLFGVVPALQGGRPDLAAVLYSVNRAATATPAVRRLRSALVVSEVALAVILVVGASLFTASFIKLIRIDPGFDYRRVLVLNVGVQVKDGKFEEALGQGGPYAQSMLEAVRSVPGVEMAAAVSGGLPLTGGWTSTAITLTRGGVTRTEDKEVDTRVVTADYMRTLRIPLLRGREFTGDDRAGTPAVALVNETAALRYWPSEDALGQRITLDEKQLTVVGVVGDVRHGGPEEPPRPEVYKALAQTPIISSTLVMRTSDDPLKMLPAVKTAIWSVNRDQVLWTDRVTLDSYMDGLIAQRRFNMAVLALLGVLGLVISAVGIHGVMTYVVTQRTREIGVRMALGATRMRVVAMVLGNAGVLVAVGLVIGGVAAGFLTTTARSFLFQLDAQDPRAFATAIVVLSIAALAATALPARRAASVDPLIALRSE